MSDDQSRTTRGLVAPECSCVPGTSCGHVACCYYDETVPANVRSPLVPPDTASLQLGGTATGRARPMRFLPAFPTDDQRKAAQRSALYGQGDMRLVWVNEGDLAIRAIAGEAVSYGKS